MLRSDSLARFGALALLAGCGGGGLGTDAPVEALSRFLETMDRGSVNVAARKEAFAMLDRDAQANISERARRAALVTGRAYEPWEMLVPGRYRLRFTPTEHSGMKATVSGDHAVIHVREPDGRNETRIPMVRQDGTWRVQLPVPAARRDFAERPPVRKP